MEKRAPLRPENRGYWDSEVDDLYCLYKLDSLPRLSRKAGDSVLKRELTK